MKDSIHHALLACSQLEIDIARISASGNEAQQGLAADCAEHRLQLANKLRHIQHIARMEESYSEGLTLGDALKKAGIEQDFKAGDFNGDPISDIIKGEQSLMEGWDEINEALDKSGDINELSDDGYRADLVRRENVERWRSYDRKANWLGWGLAAIAIGAIIALVEIVANICK